MSDHAAEQSIMGISESMHRARGYQLEMLEHTMAGNIIVAMDTGSGKTQIAILRIMAELDRCSQDKVIDIPTAPGLQAQQIPLSQLVWFLAPTVALCAQQHEAILSQLPAARTRLLIGSDNIDRWSEQRIWDAALNGVRIVVSTHAVLHDALVHGFVKITRLALLIFDEAHHCKRKHPANRIMRDFYDPAKALHGRTSVPHILGLTASPVVRSKVRDLGIIESNLDSICRSPRLQRQEMLKFVHRPVLKKLLYPPYDPNAIAPQSTVLSLLRSICRTAAPKCTTPMITGLQSVETRLQSSGYEEQLIKFERKANHVYEELGPWAANYFILESIKTLAESFQTESNFPLGWRDDEKTRLHRVLNQIPLLTSRSTFKLEDDKRVSSKVERLLSFLADQDPERCSGLVFVKQRATVSVLNALLSQHPQTKTRFRCATFVGLSNSAKRRYSMAELLDLKAQRDALIELKVKVKNLIIATDVLEEGIDVTACNLVICFDIPSNLKSFLQRRGRARQEQSTFAIMLADNSDTADKIPLWQQLEEDMIQLYQDETRILENNLAEELTEDVEFEIKVPSTGAKLTADGAMGHLHHFCALLPPQPYVDLRPAFAFTEGPSTGLVTATVTLPNCISSSVRSIEGRGAWKTKKAAVKDAAFHAYMALFRAGLLSDNLLPLTHERAMAVGKVEDLPAVTEVSGQFDPWFDLAHAWSSPDVHETSITLRQDNIDGGDELEFSLTTPSIIPSIGPIKLYWNECTTFTIILGSPCRIAPLGAETLGAMREATNIIHRSVHSDRNPDNGNDFVALFTPRIELEGITTWLESNQGKRPALDDFRAQSTISSRGFVRTPLLYGRPHIFHRWCVRETESGVDIVEVECVSLPRRRNFLHQATLSKNPVHSKTPNGQDISSKAEHFPAQDVTVDLLPFEQARFGLFIPNILQHLEVHLIAEKLCTTVLKQVHYRNIGHVITAISCPSAQWVTNYQRLEFIGDTVLKFTVSRQYFVDHTNWHEGYLSEARANITSNNTLASAAVRTGLDAFIIAEPAHTRRKPCPLISDMNGFSPVQRAISSKVLADVTEALIGAAYVDGGFGLARACINAFLPSIHVQLSAFKVLSSGDNLTNFVIKAETVIGYRFHNKGLLLESLTHPTCERDIRTESYQRLEFLGDAVLDMLVVSFLATLNVSQGEMTRIKSAIVNGHLLGFLCVDFCISEDVVDIEEVPPGVFRSRARSEQLQLWKFMRFHNQEVTRAQDRSLSRFKQLQVDIRRALDTGIFYPWVLLVRLSPEKFFSDIIESVIGAIFVDSQGDLASCQRFVEHIGIGRYLRRVCAERINVEHPRNVLERVSGYDPVQYTLDCEENGMMKSYRCTVSLKEETLVEVNGCLTEDEAMMVAAESAAKLLVERKSTGNVTGS